jgi:HEAT repeat protein
MLVRRNETAESHPPSLSNDALIGQISATDPAVRRRAVRALDSSDRSVDALIAQLAGETAPSVRSAIFNALSSAASPRAIESLLLQLRSEDAALRNGAIDALQTLPRLVGPHVERLLADPDPDVRISTVSILSALAHPDIPEWLLGVVRRDDNVNVCAAAVDALAEAGDEAAIETINALPQRFPGVPYIAFAAATAVRRIRGL